MVPLLDQTGACNPQQATPFGRQRTLDYGNEGASKLIHHASIEDPQISTMYLSNATIRMEHIEIHPNNHPCPISWKILPRPQGFAYQDLSHCELLILGAFHEHLKVLPTFPINWGVQNEYIFNAVLLRLCSQCFQLRNALVKAQSHGFLRPSNSQPWWKSSYIDLHDEDHPMNNRHVSQFFNCSLSISKLNTYHTPHYLGITPVTNRG